MLFVSQKLIKSKKKNCCKGQEALKSQSIMIQYNDPDNSESCWLTNREASIDWPYRVDEFVAQVWIRSSLIALYSYWCCYQLACHSQQKMQPARPVEAPQQITPTHTNSTEIKFYLGWGHTHTSFLSTSLDRAEMTSSRASSHASPMSASLLSRAVSIIGSKCWLNTALDTMSDWKICRKIELAASCISGCAIGKNSYESKIKWVVKNILLYDMWFSGDTPYGPVHRSKRSTKCKI